MTDLERSLIDGESVLWSGKPERFTILDATNKPVFLFRTILCAVICIVAELLYVVPVISSGAGIKWGFVAVIIIACAASPVLFLTRSLKLRKMIYAATNQRLIIVSDQVKAIEYRRIPICAFRKDADGHTTLLCGDKATKSKPGRWRELTFFANANNDRVSPCEKFAFYAVEKPEKLRSVLNGKLYIKEMV